MVRNNSRESIPVVRIDRAGGVQVAALLQHFAVRAMHDHRDVALAVIGAPELLQGFIPGRAAEHHRSAALAHTDPLAIGHALDMDTSFHAFANGNIVPLLAPIVQALDLVEESAMRCPMCGALTTVSWSVPPGPPRGRGRCEARGPRAIRGTVAACPGQNKDPMRGIINIIIILLLIGWLVGYIGFGEMLGSMIHILLVVAVIALIYNLATGKRVEP